LPGSRVMKKLTKLDDCRSRQVDIPTDRTGGFFCRPGTYRLFEWQLCLGLPSCATWAHHGGAVPSLVRPRRTIAARLSLTIAIRRCRGSTSRQCTAVTASVIAVPARAPNRSSAG
jgi:hypothetical protein